MIALGSSVVASHPAGHRLVGVVRGIGTLGVILTCQGIDGGRLLQYADGWTVDCCSDGAARWELADAHRCTVCGHLDSDGYRMTAHLRTHTSGGPAAGRS